MAPKKMTFAEVVDLFIKLYAEPTQRTWKQTERVLKKNCAAWLDRPFDEITKADALALLDPMIIAGHGPKASITKAWLRTLWRWAAWERGIVPAPIMDPVKVRYAKRERDRVYSDDELRAIWLAAGKLDAEKRAYFRLLLLLAPRKSALAGMRWSDIEDGVWTTPHALTKSRKSATAKREYLTPLPKLAKEILAQLPRNNSRVFPSIRPTPTQDTSRSLKEHGAPKDFSYHACRHTLATWLIKQKHPKWHAALVLNHAERTDVTDHYIHGGPPLDLKLELLEKFAAHVGQLTK